MASKLQAAEVRRCVTDPYASEQRHHGVASPSRDRCQLCFVSQARREELSHWKTEREELPSINESSEEERNDQDAKHGRCSIQDCRTSLAKELHEEDHQQKHEDDDQQELNLREHRESDAARFEIREDFALQAVVQERPIHDEPGTDSKGLQGERTFLLCHPVELGKSKSGEESDEEKEVVASSIAARPMIGIATIATSMRVGRELKRCGSKTRLHANQNRRKQS